MNLKDMVKWNTRVSLVYAFGIWTMVGSFAYFRYTGHYKDITVKKEEEEVQDPNTVVYESGHSKTVITYKKDFVPYTTRIYNFIQSFSSGPGSGDSDK